MKKVVMILSVLFLSFMIAVPAFPLSYEFDFNGDEVWDDNLYLAIGRRLTVKVWLDDYACPPDDLLFGTQLYVQFDSNMLQTMEAFPNDVTHGGPFDRGFSGFVERKPNIYSLTVAHFDYVDVIGNKILLGTIILKAKSAGQTSIKAANQLGMDGFNDGFVSDCDLGQRFPNDAYAEISISGCVVESIYGAQSRVVETLRYYRDNALSQTPEGRALIKLYYLWSPVIVKAMEQDEEFKEEIKEMIDGVLPMIEDAVNY